MTLPTLPTWSADPQGVQAQDIIRTYVVDEGHKDPETMEAIIAWLRKGAGDLYFLRFKLGITDQTKSDIENFRDRLMLYEDWVDSGLSQADFEGRVVRPIVLGDFRFVPDQLPNSPYKLAGIFDTAEHGQTEVSQMYRLSKASKYELGMFKEGLAKLGKDLIKRVEDVGKVTVGAAAVGGGFVLLALWLLGRPKK